MSSKTPKQARTMAAASHNPAFAKKVGIPVDVAKEFNEADTGTGIIHRKKGGEINRVKPKHRPPGVAVGKREPKRG